MFDQMKNLKNLAGLLGNAEEMKKKFEQLQEELAHQTVEADAGAGAVTVAANGKLEILSIRLDPAMIATLTGQSAEEDRQLVEELIIAASNAALAKARHLVQEQMRQMTGGINIPGLEKMLGGGA